MSAKFKVGDKVRYIGTNRNFTNGAIYEVVGNQHTTHPVVFDDECDWYVLTGEMWEFKNFELVKDAELEDLVRRANEGCAATRTLSTRYSDRVDFYFVDEYCTGGDIPASVGIQYNVKLKPPAPKFEPFTTSNGWEVRLEGDTLHIGCRNYQAAEFKFRLARIIDGANRCAGNSEYTLYATRHGIKDRDETLSWEDADRILEQLEKAGI